MECAIMVTDALREAIQKRTENGETIYMIAKNTGVDHGVIARFVRGERQLRGDTIDKLCEYLGLNLQSDDE